MITMSDTEIREWLRLLPGNVLETKMSVVKNLIAHANEDRMLTEDRMACQRALHLLHVDIAKRVRA